MPRDWDRTFKEWTQALDEIDEEKGSRASKEVREAIRNDEKLRSKRIDVYVTGSYRNNTNTRADSDVDVAVVLRDVVYYDLPSDGSLTAEMLGFKTGDYSFNAYREDVGKALGAHFGAASVAVGNKAFDIHATSYRLDADVAPLLEHRRYTGKKNGRGEWEYLSGVEMRPRSDPSARIINWPEQHYQNGCAKNKATTSRFKRVVRILKRLRAEMDAQQDLRWAQSAAGQAHSFLLECLVYNAPDTCFDQQDGGYVKDVRAVLAWIADATRQGADTSALVEVSGLKKLFAPGQRWTPEQAQAFVTGARRYTGLG